MASSTSCENCGHGKTNHGPKGNLPCNYWSGCDCTLYVNNGVVTVMPVSRAARSIGMHPIRHPVVQSAEQAQREYAEQALKQFREQAQVAQLPEVRHDSAMIEALKQACARQIARVQTGTWGLDNGLLNRLAELGKAVGCASCERAVDRGIVDKTHLTPDHVARLHHFMLEDVRSEALGFIQEFLESGVQEEEQEYQTGWREFRLLYQGFHKTEMENNALWNPEHDYTAERFWITGAQNAPWPTGEYEAVCHGSREDCLAHFQPKSRKVNQSTLQLIDSKTCTCGVYAYTEQRDATGYVAGANGLMAKVWGYGYTQIGADGRSWRATDAKIERLYFTERLHIKQNSTNYISPRITALGPWEQFAVCEVNWKGLASQLAMLYDCPVSMVSERSGSWEMQPDGSRKMLGEVLEFTAEPVIVEAGGMLGAYKTVEIV